jgi:glycerol-3-phosphate dehydrogenase
LRHQAQDNTNVAQPDGFDRLQIFKDLSSRTFDVLIVGGGINGAGIARDLALRARTSGKAISVALVDKHHFGSGTSGRNSHLIHGGLRYLKYFDFRLVREALRERATLLTIAPHLVEPLAFIMPFESRASAAFYRTGLLLYDLLAGKASIGRHRSLSRSEMHRMDPDLRQERFPSAALFYDARVDSARLVLENVLEAAANGVVAANYVMVSGRRRADGEWEVALRDTIADTDSVARAKVLIDATGAWTDTGDVRLVRGSHIIVPHGRAQKHAIAYFEPSGRIVFFIPWGEARDLLLIGTTDVDHEGGPENVRISEQEVRYLCEIACKVLRDNAIGDPIAAFSSLRPLVPESGRSATATSRDHKIFRDDQGIIRVTGGKYTTYRAMSEEAVDLAVPALRGLSTTQNTPLNGNNSAEIDRLMADLTSFARRYRLPEADVRRFIRTYGVRTPEFLKVWETECEAAPIAFAATHEMAQRLRDVFFVSTTWGYENRWELDQLVDFSSVLGRYLGWDQARIRHEAEDVFKTQIPNEPNSLVSSTKEAI